MHIVTSSSMHETLHRQDPAGMTRQEDTLSTAYLGCLRIGAGCVWACIKVSCKGMRTVSAPAGLLLPADCLSTRMALPMKRMLSAVSFEMYGGKASLAICIDTPVDLRWRRPGAEALMTVLAWICWQDRILENNRCIEIGSLCSSCAVLC